MNSRYPLVEVPLSPSVTPTGAITGSSAWHLLVNVGVWTNLVEKKKEQGEEELIWIARHQVNPLLISFCIYNIYLSMKIKFFVQFFC